MVHTMFSVGQFRVCCCLEEAVAVCSPESESIYRIGFGNLVVFFVCPKGTVFARAEMEPFTMSDAQKGFVN